MGLGEQNFCSNLREKIENVANHSLVRVPQREMVFFSCIALCNITLKQIGNNTYPSRALRHLGGGLCGESICWKPIEETENVDWWCRILISLFMLGFSCGYYFTIYQLLHFVCLVWSFLHSIFVSEYTVTDDSHLCFLIRARMAYGLFRIKRMSFRELVRLRNSQAPLLDLEDMREVLSSNKLSRRMRGASLFDLSRIYGASDIISHNVERILSGNPTYLKQQRRWEKISRDLNRECVDEQTIQMFLFILLLLSLFERADEDTRTVILYGVPGLPSLSVSCSATYAKTRSMIVQMHHLLETVILSHMAG